MKFTGSVHKCMRRSPMIAFNLPSAVELKRYSLSKEKRDIVRKAVNLLGGWDAGVEYYSYVFSDDGQVSHALYGYTEDRFELMQEKPREFIAYEHMMDEYGHMAGVTCENIKDPNLMKNFDVKPLSTVGAKGHKFTLTRPSTDVPFFANQAIVSGLYDHPKIVQANIREYLKFHYVPDSEIKRYEIIISPNGLELTQLIEMKRDWIAPLLMSAKEEYMKQAGITYTHTYSYVGGNNDTLSNPY